MDSNPFMHTGNFVDLLSQQSISFANYEDISTLSSSQHPSLHRDDVGERRERKTWTPTDDILLISSWLNTSKDLVVSNEQKAGTFWKRVAACFNASPKAAGGEERTPNNCKQRWHKINDLVCKFCGAYEAATREKTSGCNENDVLKRAHEIYHNNLKKKFTLEHAWKELRNDQKWCEVASARNEGSSKKRKCEDAEVSSAFQPSESKRPAGVKSSKARGKATVAEEALTNGFQSMWDIKQKDLEVKERLSKMKILESIIAKTEPLAEYEEALKKKLISDLMFT
ncbi:PREDICTED: glutathione S-transferase T3-like [Brassica oleracea var. oleracea]|uniref:glutathione S-transferase T3-like n=1 Tax=Brassica oleracea var. oleracea TaxID=109376 RepID=UPI0006A728C8|nr:PREDICTED: glutathione S-transferase T3-like [Brassica oleracea var. oleracea]